MRSHFLFRTVGLLFSSALSFERFCDGPAFKLAAAAFEGRRSALQAYALSQPVKKPLMGFASMALIRLLGVCAISSICGQMVPKNSEFQYQYQYQYLALGQYLNTNTILLVSTELVLALIPGEDFGAITKV